MSGSDRREGNERLLAAYLEDDLTPGEHDRYEEQLEQDAAAREEVAFQRAFMKRLEGLPPEVVPEDFVGRVMESASGLPGSWTHRLEVVLSRFMRPAMVGATALAAWMVFAPIQPPPGMAELTPAASNRGTSLALLEVGTAGGTMGGHKLAPEQRKALGSGQVIHLAAGPPSTLRFPGHVTATVQGGSTFSISAREIRLESGQVRVRVKPGIGNFQVRAPHASAHVIGTEFEVRTDGGQTSVAVQHGIVEVRSPQSLPVRLEKGKAVQASRNGLRPLRPQDLAGSGELPRPPLSSPEGVPGLDSGN